MPTYDYECKACGHKFEKFQSITSRPIRKCPICKANHVKRLIGMGAGVIFKGSGFYQTDYRSSAYDEAAKKDKESATSDSTTSESKSSDSTMKESTADSSKADTKTTDSKADKPTPAPKKTTGS